MGNAAVLLCAGSGLRMKGQVEDKALVPLLKRPALHYSLEAFIDSDAVDLAVIVTRDSMQRKMIESVVKKTLRRQRIRIPKEHRLTDVPGVKFPVQWVEGGRRRQDSVANALEAIPENIQNVFIHDCARPVIRFTTIRELSKIAERDKAVCPAHRLVDTIKEAESSSDSLRLLKLTDCDRNRLWAMETPQVFERGLICAAYRRAQKEGWDITDDASAVLRFGHRVSLLETPYPNPKLTIPEDIAIIEHLLANIPTPYGMDYM